MEITITVPELTCTRCGVAAPLQPHLLFLRARIPTKFREMFSHISREQSVATAKDSASGDWDVFVADRPPGWVQGPASSNLCSDCAAQWSQTNRDFMIPPLPPIEVVDEMAPTETLDAASERPARPSYEKKRSAPYGASTTKPHGVRR